MNQVIAASKLQALRSALRHASDKRLEPAIVDMFKDASNEELNYFLLNTDLVDLLSKLDGGLLGSDESAPLLDLLSVTRSAELSLPVRVSLASALQFGHTPKPQEKALLNLFLGLSGRELTDFKNLVDAGGNHHDLQQLVFRDIDDPAIRTQLLAHIQAEAAAHPAGENKVISDIDDTFLASLKDWRYPRDTVYPGVLAFYDELTRGPGATRSADPRNIVFLSGRPQDPLTLVENITLEVMRQHGVTTAVMLSGSLLHLVGNRRIAAKKLENLDQYLQLFPEYGFVLVGDSGQGDVDLSIGAYQRHPHAIRAAFIHDIKPTPPQRRQELRDRQIYFFDTYVGAAVDAFETGVISYNGLNRIADAAQESLAAVSFTTTAMREAREAEFARDLARAHAASPS
ncbi:hypothetical protein GCM10022251_77020 [Phytohabitans flavus]|uniref:Phosphatidate phosphatase APP1 catalytic domain-containing protein n=1 Tax=Phytohabitans flavus TaxID=1076124 RepID=A0A6F8XLP4_9ACTN|nr:phosphatase domain-containing protein [Phytohabitans flavus]BCB74727.1 hypothetical protein Pflav_011370 [Phytohabitans flavus]